MAKQGKDYDRWVKAAAELGRTDNPLSLPYDVAVREAVAAAAFVKKYWEPEGDRPGLKRVKSRLPASSSDDLLSIVHAVQEAQTRLLLIVDPVVADVGERARFVVDELESAIEFLLDDDVDEPADAQLARIKEFHAQDGQRSSALSQALRDYAGLAASLESGKPVVSISLGDTARFLFGGVKRRDPVETMLLESGDAFVFGGPSRLRYHGVSRIIPHTSPAAVCSDGRFNLTFRQY